MFGAINEGVMSRSKTLTYARPVVNCALYAGTRFVIEAPKSVCEAASDEVRGA